ncbi:MAG TPA: hypothetical protein VMW54_03145 [Terriglobia bacterium]|nr:hypothetical protein [Terriglobia bacterium]
MRKIYRLLLATTIALWMPSLMIAQNSPTQKPPAAELANTPGVTAFVQAVAKRSNLGTVYNEGLGIGYNFTNHVGADIGLSLYTVQSPYSTVISRDWRWTTLLGDPFVDVRYTTKRYGLDIASVLTGSIPAASPEKVYSTGRVGVDWYNHIEAHYKGLAPFLNFGAANETVDRYVLPRPYNIARPYQILGVNSNFEGGASYTFLRHYSIGASAYAIVPSGSQKVFSRLVSPDSAVAGDASHNRVWNSAFETIGDSRLARDNGYSGWVDVTPIKNWKVQVGYTYSVHYAMGFGFVMLRFDGTSLMRYLTATQ